MNTKNISFKSLARFAAFALVLLLFSENTSGQITITTGDMPSPGDTIRKSNAVTTGSIDYTLTGENYQWDFTELFSLYQTVDEFESVSSVPFLYQLVFIPNFVANLAMKFPDIDTLGLPIADPYRFFKNSASSFTDVGFAITVSDIPIPLKFNNADVVYDFPLNYGNADSSISGVDFGIPDLGFISIDRKRVNVVDGWGTLSTSYGNYDVLRLKSTVHETDSIYIDSISFGTALDRNYTEYKWMANGFDTPLLQVNKEGLLVTVAWIDSIFDPATAIVESQFTKPELLLNPNPITSTGNITIEMDENSRVEIVILNIAGTPLKYVFEGRLTEGRHTFELNRKNINLVSGIYFVRLKTQATVITRKLIVR